VTIAPERLPQLDTIHLDTSSHPTFADGHCAMEVVAWLAGEGHTDAPACASRVLRSYTIAVNDRWGDEQRQKLIPYLPRMVGTGDDGKDEARSYMALDWLVRSFTPTWLDLAGLTVEAAELRALRRIVDLVSAKAAGPVVRSARDSAQAAWDAAWAAAGDAAWDAAGAATRDATRAAAGDAAWDAAGDATRAAAWAAAGDAARDASRDAARDAAWDAAGAAARDATRAATGDAARDAAGARLAPTVTTLQASALDLLDRMIDPSAVTA
jgi:hypothetical protein